MIRSRYPHFLHFKQTHRNQSAINSNNNNNYNYPNPSEQPHWYQAYHDHKQTIKIINQNSDNILLLASNYQHSPTVYSLKQLQKSIQNNSLLIDQVQKWVKIKEPTYQQSLWSKIHANIQQHFAMEISRHIMIILQAKSRIQAVNLQMSRNNVSMHSGVSNNISNHNISHNNISMNNISFEQGNRSHYSNPQSISFRNNTTAMVNHPRQQEQINQISHQIQYLSSTLQRMNHLVQSQGQLVNRIDQNILKTSSNVNKGHEQLKKRLRRQDGQGQFSIYGRINKAIMTLYVINLCLILAFLLKNIIF